MMAWILLNCFRLWWRHAMIVGGEIGSGVLIAEKPRNAAFCFMLV